MGHHQCSAVVGDHSFEEPGDAVVPCGGGARHLHGLNLGRAHALQAAEAVGITPAFQGHGIDGGLRVPGLAPLTHGLDLLGLVPPDALGQGAHARRADVEHELAHAQGAGVVLHHRVDPAQVVGAAGWTHLVGVTGVAARPLAVGSGSRGALMVLMMVVVLLGITLRQGRGGPDACQQERCSEWRHGDPVVSVLTMGSPLDGESSGRTTAGGAAGPGARKDRRGGPALGRVGENDPLLLRSGVAAAIGSQ